MTCMKCGSEIESESSFCPKCLEEMKKYPVKPGTPIQLPTRSGAAAKKNANPKRPAMKEKEQIARLTHRNKTLATLLILTILALSAVSYFLVRELTKVPEKPAGQNYTTTTIVDAAMP